MQRRTRRTLVFGLVALAFYVLHFAWFAFSGPPEWFHGVGRRAPELRSIQLGSAFDSYLDEFDRPRQASLAPPDLPGLPDGTGDLVGVDRFGAAGPALASTRDAGRDRLFLHTGEAWSEIALEWDGRVSQAMLVRAGGAHRVLLVLRRPWWPFARSYPRFWIALFRGESRPENGMLLVDPSGENRRYLFPGRQPIPSPDRSAVAFLRSDGHGYHSVHLFRPSTGEVRTVVSLWEVDPGSGPSFHYVWSADSEVLFVRGSSRGFQPAIPSRRVSDLRLLYDVAGDRLVELGDRATRSASRESDRR